MKNSKIIVKSNTLIEASYRLSTQEQRIILNLAAKIQKHDKDFKNYSFSIHEFAEMTGTKAAAKYTEVKALTSNLLRRVFTINEPSGPLQLSWLSAAKYHDGEGKITLRFDPGLKPYLLQLKSCFTKLSLGMILKLKSSFSIRIYELLKQYESIGIREYLLKDLKNILGIKDKYKQYGHFKAKVLKVAQEELLAKTDIAFDFEEIKIGRKVGKIRFIIKSNKLAVHQPVFAEVIDMESEIPEDDLQAIFELIPQEYRKQKTIKKIILEVYKQHGFDYVARNIQYTNQNSNAAKPGANLTKGSNYRNYLAKALQNDFGLAHQEDLEAAQQKENSQKEKQRKQAEQDRLEREKIEREKDLARKAREYMETFSDTALQELKSEAMEKMDPELKEKALKNHVIGNVTIKRAMEKIVIERFLVKENMN